MRECTEKEIRELDSKFVYDGTDFGFDEKPETVEQLKKEIALHELQDLDGAHSSRVAMLLYAIDQPELAFLAGKSDSYVVDTSSVDQFLFLTDLEDGLQVWLNFHSY